MSSDDITTPADDPNKFGDQLQREIARIQGDEYNGTEYEGIRDADAESIDNYHLGIADSATSNQLNHLQHLRNISGELEQPILETSADNLNRTLQRMERDRGWKTDPPGSRKNYAISLAACLRENSQYEKADNIIVPKVRQEDYALDPEEIPSWGEHVLPMIEAEPNARNKALIATGWDSASRITVLSAFKIKHYEHLGDSSAILKIPEIDGDKDAGLNEKPLVIARALIDNWLANGHPRPDDPEAALFCSVRENRDDPGDHIGPKNIREEIVYPAAKRVEIKDDDEVKIHPHMLKHSRIQNLKKHPDVDKASIETIADWSANSEQHKIYGPTTATDDAKTLLQQQGIELEDDDREDITIDCPRCNTTIAAGFEHCPTCTQKLSDTPPEWYEYYQEIVYEDNVLRQEYDDIATAAQPLHKLPKDHYEYITDIFAKAVVLYDTQWTDPADYPGTHPRTKDWADKIDISGLDEEDIDTISERWVTSSEPLAQNYLENTSNYEISESDEGLSVDELHNDAVRLELIDGKIIDTDDDT